MATWKNGQDDDFFGGIDDRDTDPEHPKCSDGYELHSGLMQAEIQAQSLRQKTSAYHHAYDVAKEECLQEGFEEGYQENFELSRRMGAILGKLYIRDQLRSTTPKQNGTLIECSAEKSMNIDHPPPPSILAAQEARRVLTAPQIPSGEQLQALEDRLLVFSSNSK